MFGDRYFGKRYFGNRYFGPGATAAVAGHQPGGGYYRRPIIYLDRDGKPVDLKQYGKEPVVVPEHAQPVELTPEILAALSTLPTPYRPPVTDPVAGLDAKMGRMMIERELAAMQDDDAILALLLAS